MRVAADGVCVELVKQWENPHEVLMHQVSIGSMLCFTAMLAANPKEGATELLVINFRLDGWTEADYRIVCDEIAPAFAAVPGLATKVWLADSIGGIYGGVYFFENAAALDAFLGSELFAQVRAMTQLTDISVHRFGVLDAPTAVTRGLVGASI